MSHAPRRTLAAALAVLLVGPGCAGGRQVPDRGELVMRDLSFPLRELRHPSGLRVVVEEDVRAPVVALVSVVGAGSAQDPAGREGLAHLVEHLAFRARPDGGPSAGARFEAAGVAEANATTDLDATTYVARAPREALAELLRTELARLAAPLAGVTPEVFDVEREVVRSELRQRNETGYVGQVYGWLQQAAFPAGHPYARPVIGTHASLSALTLQDAQAFAARAYRPENVTLVLTGDVDLRELDALLADALPAAWAARRASPAPRPAVPGGEPPLAPAPGKLVEHRAAVAGPELYVAWTLPAAYGGDDALQAFVAASLRANASSATHTDADVGAVDVDLVPGQQASLLVLRALLTRGDRPERSLDALLSAAAGTWGSSSLTATLGDALAVAAVRRGTAVGLALESQDVLARAWRRAELTHFTRDARAYGRHQSALLALEGAKATSYAYQWLQRDRARAVLVRPGAVGVGAQAGAARVLEADAAAQPGPLALEALARPQELREVLLPNGLRLVLARRPGVPVVVVGAALGGGLASGPGLAGATVGGSGRDAAVPVLAQMASYRRSWFKGAPSDWGLHVSESLERDHLRYTVAGAAGNVGNVLEVLAEQLAHTRTSVEVMEALRRDVLPLVGAREARPDEAAERALRAALYGPHPYGQLPDAAQLGRVTQAQVQAWLDAAHRPGNATVVVAGEFDPAAVEAHARRTLGGWGGVGRPQPVAPAPVWPLEAARARPRALVTPSEGATQAHVTVACRLPEAGPEGVARAALLAEVLEARLAEAVRARRGASYGFGVGAAGAGGGAAHLRADGLVDTARLGEALGEVRDALGEWGAGREGLRAELERARARLLAREAVALTTAEAWVDALLDAQARGHGLGAVAQRAGHLRGASFEAVRQDAAACLGGLVVGVTGDAGAAEAALQATWP